MRRKWIRQLRKQYSTLLDEVYKLSSLTSVLDGPSELVREGANANEILIPKLSMQGLANYDKNSGYVSGDVTLDYETKKCAYDRGRMFNIDAMDNIESAGIAFGRLAGEFLRTQVVPELDAYRLASYAQISGVTTVSANLTDGKVALAGEICCGSICCICRSWNWICGKQYGNAECLPNVVKSGSLIRKVY